MLQRLLHTSVFTKMQNQTAMVCTRAYTAHFDSKIKKTIIVNKLENEQKVHLISKKNKRKACKILEYTWTKS